MDYKTQMLLVLIFGVALHLAMIFGSKRIKKFEQIRKSLLIIVPNVLLNSAIMFLTISGTTKSFLPDAIEDSGENAEQRIARLESYTEKLNNYLEYSNKQFLLLVGVLALLNSMPLIVIAFALSKSEGVEDN